MSGSPRIVQISVSPRGVPKRAVPSARVTTRGIEGDAQRDREHHGDPDRALCLHSHERILALGAEGHPISPGSCLRLGDSGQLLAENEPLVLIGPR